MKIKTKVAAAVIIITVAMSVTGCKPSEKNYQAAYDAATKHKQEMMTDDVIDMSIVHLEDTPRRITTESGSAYIRYDYISLYSDKQSDTNQSDTKKRDMKKYNVAVAAYKMRANAEADAEQLTADGYDAFVMQDGKSVLYVIAASLPTLDEAVAFTVDFKKKNPKRPFVGLPEEPVIYTR